RIQWHVELSLALHASGLDRQRDRSRLTLPYHRDQQRLARMAGNDVDHLLLRRETHISDAHDLIVFLETRLGAWIPRRGLAQDRARLQTQHRRKLRTLPLFEARIKRDLRRPGLALGILQRQLYRPAF